jgi:hypothetical protein
MTAQDRLGHFDPEVATYEGKKLYNESFLFSMFFSFEKSHVLNMFRYYVIKGLDRWGWSESFIDFINGTCT